MNVYVVSARLRSLHYIELFYSVLNYFIQLWIILFSYELFYSVMNYFIHLWIILFIFELFYTCLNFFIRIWIISFTLNYFINLWIISFRFVCLSCGLMSAPLLNLLAESGTSGLFACLFKLWADVSSLTESPCSLRL